MCTVCDYTTAMCAELGDRHRDQLSVVGDDVRITLTPEQVIDFADRLVQGLLDKAEEHIKGQP